MSTMENNQMILPPIIDSALYVAVSKLWRQSASMNLGRNDLMEGFVFFVADSLSTLVEPIIAKLPLPDLQGQIFDIVQRALPIELLLQLYRWMMLNKFGSFPMILMDTFRVTLALGIGDFVKPAIVSGFKIKAQ